MGSFALKEKSLLQTGVNAFLGEYPQMRREANSFASELFPLEAFPLPLSIHFDQGLLCAHEGICYNIVLLLWCYIFYTPPHNSGGILWFHVGRP